MDRFKMEKKLWEEGYRRVMGLDEAGRGCLSGPVVAAGVIFEPGSGPGLEELRDSKTLELSDRERLAELVKERAAWWSVQQCSPGEIDELNILHASLRAMVRCTEQEGGEPDYLLVDGNRFPDGLLPRRCVVGGDDRSASIAAASILAKVHRDRLMKKLHETYPHYGWKTNVGYPTREHYRGLAEHGITPHHRRTFRLRTEKIYRED
ncbi:MAG: ribonuclease HII [Balneolaceae bacterium]|nr:ribonuclease HII [Balneolaceae bacterium]